MFVILQQESCQLEYTEMNTPGSKSRTWIRVSSGLDYLCRHWENVKMRGERCEVTWCWWSSSRPCVVWLLHLRAHAGAKAPVWGCVQVQSSAETSYLHPAPRRSWDVEGLGQQWGNKQTGKCTESPWKLSDLSSETWGYIRAGWLSSKVELVCFFSAFSSENVNRWPRTTRRVPVSPRRLRVLAYFHFSKSEIHVFKRNSNSRTSLNCTPERRYTESEE